MKFNYLSTVSTLLTNPHPSDPSNPPQSPFVWIHEERKENEKLNFYVDERRGNKKRKRKKLHFVKLNVLDGEIEGNHLGKFNAIQISKREKNFSCTPNSKKNPFSSRSPPNAKTFLSGVDHFVCPLGTQKELSLLLCLAYCHEPKLSPARTWLCSPGKTAFVMIHTMRDLDKIVKLGHHDSRKSVLLLALLLSWNMVALKHCMWYKKRIQSDESESCDGDTYSERCFLSW